MIKLYQKDVKGNIRVWSIEIRNNCLYSESGILNGTMIPCSVEVVRMGNKTLQEQAEFDLNTEVKRKLKSGYVEDLANIKTKGETATINKPAKGLVYHPFGKNSGLTLDKLNLRNKKVGIQTKLDGWRYRIWTDGFICKYYTSSGDEVEGFPQITETILSKFPYFSQLYNVDEVILDGEIYNHELGFQKVQSACGTKIPNPTSIELRKMMQFYIFDILNPSDYTRFGYYQEREVLITYFIDGKSIIKVDTVYLIANEVSIDGMFETVLSKGYEGLIIRQLNYHYEHKKSKQFLKYKPLIDDEFTVIGFEKSITGDTLGSLVCETFSGKEFNTNLKGEIGTDKYKQYIWDNKSQFLNQKVTVEFLEYTDDDIPRLPRAKCFRDKINN